MNITFKQSAAALLAALALPVMAVFDRPAIVFFHDGNVKGYVGHDVKLTCKQNVQEIPGGVKFNGKDSILVFGIPWLYPGKPLSVTIVADVTPEKFGANMTVAGRTGYDNAIGIRADGHVTFNCFSPGDSKTAKVAHITSKFRLKPGVRYRIAGVMDCNQGDNNCHLTLYVNGDCAGTAVLQGPPREYSRDFFVGGSARSRNGKVRNPLCGTVHEAAIFYKALSRTDVCRLPGSIDKKNWNAYKPVVDFKNAKGRQELKGDSGVMAYLYKMPFAPDSVTMTAKVKINKLPQKSGVICGRPGFDNAIDVAPDGRIGFSGWNASKTDSLHMWARSKVKAGDTVRVTGVVESCGVETRFSLYVNGKLEAYEVIVDKVRPYGPEFCIKGIISHKGKARNDLDCEVLDCRIYGIALSAGEIGGGKPF